LAPGPPGRRRRRAKPCVLSLGGGPALEPPNPGAFAMAVALFMVRASISKDKEAAFNRWYNEEHVPDVLKFNGAVSGRRYKKILGEDKFEYLALYEFASEAVFRHFLESDHLKTLVKEYDAHFAGDSERERAGYVQVFP